MTRYFTLALVTAVLCIPLHARNTSELPLLPPLTQACEIFLDSISLHEDGLYLRCRGVTFRVYHPKNLTGLVHLGSVEAALRFVRFFTSRRTFHLVGLNGDVEVRPNAEASSSDFFPAKRIPDGGLKVDVVEYTDAIEGRTFVIKRYVVSLDQRLYRITERVTEHGNYAVTERVVVENDATKLGIVHIGAH